MSGKSNGEESGRDERESGVAVEELEENDLVEMFAGYVHSIVGKIWKTRRCYGLTREDLSAYGFGGLLEAFRNFDSSRGTEFASYAYPRIRGAVLDALRRVQWAPRDRTSRRRDDVDPTRANITSRHFRDAAQGESFDADAASVPEEGPLYTYLMEPSEIQKLEFGERGGQREHVELAQKLKLLRQAMDRLSKFERTVIRLYDIEGRTMLEIAEEMSCTKSWITRVRDRAMEEMREYIAESTERECRGELGRRAA